MKQQTVESAASQNTILNRPAKVGLFSVADYGVCRSGLRKVSISGVSRVIGEQRQLALSFRATRVVICRLQMPSGKVPTNTMRRISTVSMQKLNRLGLMG